MCQVSGGPTRSSLCLSQLSRRMCHGLSGSMLSHSALIHSFPSEVTSRSQSQNVHLVITICLGGLNGARSGLLFRAAATSNRNNPLKVLLSGFSCVIQGFGSNNGFNSLLIVSLVQKCCKRSQKPKMGHFEIFNEKVHNGHFGQF